jgi:hypothetical protein
MPHLKSFDNGQNSVGARVKIGMVGLGRMGANKSYHPHHTVGQVPDLPRRRRPQTG